jgi:hypothetical protein
MKNGERNEVILQDCLKFMHVMFNFGFRDILTNILLPNHILDEKDHV